MKDVPYKGESSCFLLLWSEASLLQAVSGVVPCSILKVRDVKLRDEQFVLDLAELVTVIDDKLSYIFDARCNVDAFLPFCVHSICLFYGLAIDSVGIDGYNVTCNFSEKLLHDSYVLNM